MTKAHTAGAYTEHNTVHLVTGGAMYFNLLEKLIHEAQKSIHLQVYIFDGDETGNRILDALGRAARRGVKVHLLLDGYASRSLTDETIQYIRDSGIFLRWFEPLWRSQYFYIGRRMHHKILVVDALQSLVGGINISNHYNDIHGEPGWLDWAAHVSGEASVDLHNRCAQVWHKGNYQPIKATPSDDDPNANSLVRIRINDWIRNKNQISRSYIEMFHRAQSHITLMSSYFLPGYVFRKNLRLAAKRGVKIRLILTKLSDVKTAKLAERFFYPWLLRRNIEIYEYRKKILHGKIATYDNHWVTVGSFNFNNISAYASVELNLDILNSNFATQVNDTLEKIIQQDCDRITLENFSQQTTWWDKLVYRSSYELIRFIFFLFTFYFRQRKER